MLQLCNRPTTGRSIEFKENRKACKLLFAGFFNLMMLVGEWEPIRTLSATWAIIKGIYI
jgi:hypothetical protein